MKQLTIYRLILCVFLSFFSQILFAWDNSIEFGFGYSHDPNHSKYHNSGFLLSGDFYPLYRSPLTFWSIGGALGQWYTTEPHDKNLTTAALTLDLRIYPFHITDDYPAYLYASAGPAFLSNRQFGLNTQASNLTIQSNLGLGIEFNCIDVNLRFEHFSNAGLGDPNQGFNILYLVSLGYLF